MVSGIVFFFKAEEGIRDSVASRGVRNVYKSQLINYQPSPGWEPLPRVPVQLPIRHVLPIRRAQPYQHDPGWEPLARVPVQLPTRHVIPIRRAQPEQHSAGWEPLARGPGPDS